MRLGLIVSGKSEKEIIPLLIARITDYTIRIRPRDIRRKPEARLFEANGQELRESTSDLLWHNHCDAVLLVADSEDYCPAKTAPALQSVMESTSNGRRCSVALAWRELESWYLCDQMGLFGQIIEAKAERRDAKAPIRHYHQHRRTPPGTYRETVDGVDYARRMDIPTVRAASDSFDVFCRRVEEVAAQSSP